jgi:hypothetical protein
MSLALDSLSPTSACGLRKLLTAYGGNCVKVDNGSGGMTDVGFNGTALDRIGLDASHANAYCNTLYDQSGNARNIVGTFGGIIRLTSRTTTIGKRAAAWSNGTVGSYSGNVGTLITNAAGTILWAGACLLTNTNNAAPEGNNGAWGDNFGIVGVGVKTAGYAAALETYSAVAYNDDNLMDSVAADIPRYAPLLIAWRHSGGQIQINVNGGGWTQAASGNTRAVTGTMSLGRSGDFLHGEFCTFNTALSDASVDAWGAEAAAYWGGAWGAAASSSVIVLEDD